MPPTRAPLSTLAGVAAGALIALAFAPNEDAPGLALFHAALRHGELATWDPLHSTGAPGILVGAWDPLRLGAFLAGAPWGERVNAVLALLVAGLGAARWLRALGASASSATASAWIVQAAVLVLERTVGASAAHAAAWIPWGAAALASTPPRELALAAATTAFALLSGAHILAALLAATAMALGAIVRTRRGERLGAWTARALPAVLLGCAAAAVDWAPRFIAEAARQPSARGTPVSPSTAAAIRRAAGDGRVVELARDGTEPPLGLAASGVAELAPSDRALPARVRELLERLDPSGTAGSGGWRLRNASLANHTALDRLRVACVVAREPLANPRLELVHVEGGVSVYRRAGALPLARVVPAELLRVPGDVAVLGLLQAGGLDSARVAVANAEELAGVETPTEAFVAGELLVRSSAADRIDIEVRGSSGGWLVFHASFAEGWKAVVDGRDAEFARLDHVYRAVPIPPGNTIVRTKYEPDALRFAAAASVLAWILVLALATRAASGA